MRDNLLLAISVAMAVSTGIHASTPLTLSNTQPLQKKIIAVAAAQPKLPPQAAIDVHTVYIVQLTQPAVASYNGGINNLSATNPRANGVARLDVNNAASLAYADFLSARQQALIDNIEQTLGRAVTITFRYRHAFNGIALALNADEAATVQALPAVANISKQRVRPLLTDVGPQWIGADSLWGNASTEPNHDLSRGEGVVIAVLDSGINNTHPSFAAASDDGYVHQNPLGSGNFIPGSYCDTEDTAFCNDKLIGAWAFSGSTDPGSPQDDHRHGSHTASTAAGNTIATPALKGAASGLIREISGVAPRASIIAYDVCVQIDCATAPILAAIEQVIIDAAALPDGIQALNFSIGGGVDPYNDPVEIGFLNATAAGIFVAASAGNDGPSRGTVGHNGPWVMTVAAMTHNRTHTNSLIDLTSDGLQLGDINGVGLTAGYGPAPIIHARDFPTSNGTVNDFIPQACSAPFPPGHFNGEIVICDGGFFSQADAKKDNHVLAGGAGGFVLAAPLNNPSPDAHALPGVSIGFDSAQTLEQWLATQTNTLATIAGATIDLAPSNGDIMYSLSSRGPGNLGNILKPDVAAPGTQILAAVANDGVGDADYGFVSGTSMAAPHVAGSGALISAIRPQWSPYAIKSVLMMTAKSNGLRKEDGVNPTDLFDVGAGRIDLRDVQHVGVILDETIEHFLAANPATGGDLTTLNIASMQNDSCVGSCSWTRTFTSVSDRHRHYALHPIAGDGVDITVKPRYLRLAPGASAHITVTADTSQATDGWHFAELQLKPRGWGGGPDLHIPIAVNPSTSSDSQRLIHTVNKDSTHLRDTLTYTISVTGNHLTDTLSVDSQLPPGLKLVPGSMTAAITNGATLDPFNNDRDHLKWRGTLATQGELTITESRSPRGFIALKNLGVTPAPCPDNRCDEGGLTLSAQPFVYNGQTYNQVIWSVNGTLQVGSTGGTATGASPQAIPDTAAPNNLLAPLWTDLDLSAEDAQWYTALLTIDTDEYMVYEWNNAALSGDDATRYTFQIWVQSGDSGNIWFVYDRIDNTAPTTGLSVGIENSDGTVGTSYFSSAGGNVPTPGIDLKVARTPAGKAVFTYQAEVVKCARSMKPIVSRIELSSATGEASAIAVSQCQQHDGETLDNL